MKSIDVLAHKGTFFKILGGTPASQIGVMTVSPGNDSGPEETHAGDQIIYVIEGKARVTIGDATHNLTEGMLALIPARTIHHIINSGTDDLFFLTMYAPPAY